MSTRKSMTLPIIITFIFICIIVYLFINIKQSIIICDKTTVFDSDIKIIEIVRSETDGKKINRIQVTKKIILPSTYPKLEENITGIKNSIDKTLSYLGDSVSYSMSDNVLLVRVDVSHNELVLLDNISFYDNDGELVITVNPNTKSSEVISLKVGDTYTDGELMKLLKNRGFSCK